MTVCPSCAAILQCPLFKRSALLRLILLRSNSTLLITVPHLSLYTRASQIFQKRLDNQRPTPTTAQLAKTIERRSIRAAPVLCCRTFRSFDTLRLLKRLGVGLNHRKYIHVKLNMVPGFNSASDLALTIRSSHNAYRAVDLHRE
jgi:hypothetical protein